MLGFLVGTLCLIGLFKVIKHQRYGYAGYGHHFGGGGGCGKSMRGGHDHHGGMGFGGFGGFPGFGGGFGRMGARGPLRYVFSRLETTPGQEKVISEEVENVMTAVQSIKGDFSSVRQTLANAVRSPVFNVEAIAELQVKQDIAIEKVREAIKTSLSKIHESLDDKQRQELAHIIEGGFRGGRGAWV